jgi:hypothetical protein
MRADAAERQIKPFIAVTFGTSTTFFDLEDITGTKRDTSSKKNVVFGVGGAMLWDLFGIEVDVAHAPGFFQHGAQPPLVLASSVTTVAGNFVATLPRRMTEYSLRPYFVGGAGVMRVRIDDVLGALRIHESLALIDLGGGATGFVSDTWGVYWDVRYFRSFSRDAKAPAVSIGPEQLSFWRASMGIVLR